MSIRALGVRQMLSGVLALIIMACSGPTTQPATPITTPAPTGTTASTSDEHMDHEAQHGGQLGMSEEMHIEIVSERPGEYQVYLSNSSGSPLPLEGVMLEVALIDSAGNELLVFPATISDGGEFFIATGGPTDIPQADVRVKVLLAENTEPVEMDFTLQYQRPAPSPTTAPAPAAAATAPAPMPAVECKAGEPWLQTREGLTLAMCFDPYPPQLGSPGAYEAMIVDATGQPVAEASVELTLVGGMGGMEGEHDEDFTVRLIDQGGGRYAAQATVGPSDLVLTGVTIEVLSGRQSWSFSITADELGSS